MNLLSWKPAYALGIPSVDLEHQELIAMINATHVRLEQASEDVTDRDAIAAMLGEIHAAIAAHFALEERVMRTAGYAGYVAHKDDHENLLEQILAMMDVYAADPEQGRQQLSRSLSEWFGRHFSSFDASLHGELVACNSQSGSDPGDASRSQARREEES